MEPVEQTAVITKSELSSLNDTIKHLSNRLTAVKEIEDKLCGKVDQIAKDHEKQVDVRIERLNQQYAKLEAFTDEHHKLFIKESLLLQQLQTGCFERENSLAQLRNMLDEAQNKLTESDVVKNELTEILNEAYKKLAESDSEKNKLAEKLDEANNTLKETVDVNNQLRTDLNNSRMELQTSRLLAAFTKLRQLNELVLSEEISAVISRLKEDTAATAGNIKKYEAETACSNAGDADDVTGDANKLDEDDMGFCLPG